MRAGAGALLDVRDTPGIADMAPAGITNLASPPEVVFAAAGARGYSRVLSSVSRVSDRTCHDYPTARRKPARESVGAHSGAG